MPKLTKNGVTYDSQEEWQMAEMLSVMERMGLVSNVQYHPKSFLLSEPLVITELPAEGKKKAKLKHVFRKHHYTPDFCFRIHHGPQELSHGLLLPDREGVYWIDVKGRWNAHRGDHEFSINQKWVWNAFGIFINKVIPGDFCLRIGFAPDVIRMRLDKKGVRKDFIGTVSPEEWDPNSKKEINLSCLPKHTKKESTND